MLSFLFSRPVPGVSLVVSYRADDLHRRHPLRRQVAEWMRLRGVDRLQVEPLADDDVRLLVRALHPGDDVRGGVRLHRRPRRGQPVLHRGARRRRVVRAGPRRARRRAAGPPRPPRRDHPHGSSASSPSPGARSATRCWPPSPTSARPSSRPRSATPSRPTSSSPRAAAPTPSATRCSARRSTTTCCPASGSGSTPTSCPRWARAAPSAPRPSSPSTPVAPTTGPSPIRASIEAGEEALAVGGPSEAATHFLDALELIDTSRTPVPDVDAHALARRCAEALIAAGRVPKAVKVLRARLATLPADGSDARPRPAADGARLGAAAHRHHRVARARRPPRRSSCCATARPSCWPARSSSTPRASATGTPTRRARRPSRRSTSPSATTSPASPSSCTPRSPASTPTAARTPAPAGGRRPSAPGGRAHRARAARPLLPRPAPPRPRRPRRGRRGLPRGDRAQRGRRARLVALPGRVAAAARGRADPPGPARRGVATCSTSPARTRRWSTSGSSSPTRC